MKNTSLIKRIILRIRIFFYKLPMIGEIKNRYFSPVATINSKEFGKSFSMPSVLEVAIDNEKSFPANVGKLVNDIYFKDDPKVIFNVSFSCGKSGFFKKGKYTDPLSIWFNVFFGYYELDVVAKDWKRPIGYNIKNNEESINSLDMIKIAKADWNYFSNYMYGVPEDYIKKCNEINLDIIKSEYLGRVKIGNKYWDFVEVDNLEVVSAYNSPHDTAIITNNSILSPAWRACFGNLHPRSELDYKSYFKTNMKARFYVSYKKEIDIETNLESYKTYIFGGTINHSYDKIDKDKNERFLELQLESTRNVIKKHFKNIGFDK